MSENLIVLKSYLEGEEGGREPTSSQGSTWPSSVVR